MWPLLLPLARSDPQRCLTRQLLPREYHAPERPYSGQHSHAGAELGCPAVARFLGRVTLPDQARPKAGQGPLQDYVMVKAGRSPGQPWPRVGIYTSFGPSIPVYTCIYTDTRIYGLNTSDD